MKIPHSQTHPGVARGFRIYAQVAAMLMLTSGGGVVLADWLGFNAARAVATDGFLLPADSALAFVIAGAALLSFVRGKKTAARGCALLSLLLWYVAGKSLVQSTGDISALRHPAAMSPLAAIGFLLLGAEGIVACLTSDRRMSWLQDVISIPLLAIAMGGLAAFGFHLGALSQGGTGMAPISVIAALLFLMAALGWMSARPDQGITRIATADSLGGALARRLLLPSLLLPLLFAFAMQFAQDRFAYSAALTTSLAALVTGGSVATLIWWVATLVDRIERERLESQRARDSAKVDGLTGLLNRHAFDQAIDGLLRGRRENDSQFCLLMLDLDFFKSYNDSFGHLAGDEAIRITGRIVHDALRPSDIPARYGGEEFAVLLPGSNGADGVLVAERIVEIFRREPWPHRTVTISVGVAEAMPGDVAKSLIGRADAALYAAKNSGRDRAVLAALPIDRAIRTQE